MAQILVFVTVMILVIFITTRFTDNFDKIFYVGIFTAMVLAIVLSISQKNIQTTKTHTQYLKLNSEGHTQYSTQSGGINTTIYTVKTVNGKSIDVSNPTVTYNQTKHSKMDVTTVTETKTLFGFKTSTHQFESSAVYIIK